MSVLRVLPTSTPLHHNHEMIFATAQILLLKCLNTVKNKNNLKKTSTNKKNTYFFHIQLTHISIEKCLHHHHILYNQELTQLRVKTYSIIKGNIYIHIGRHE